MAKSDTANPTQSSASASAPTQYLIVIHPFGNYAKGTRIEDAAEIAKVLASGNTGSCNRIAAA